MEKFLSDLSTTVKATVRPRVGVFRHTQLRLSEQFITGQADALERYVPVLLSRDRPKTDSRPVHSLAEASPLAAVLYRAGSTRAARAFLRDSSVDVLHAHFGVEGAAIRREAMAQAIPLVVTLHGFDVMFTDGSFRRTLKPSMMQYPRRRRALFADRRVSFIAVSRFLADRAVERGLAADRLEVIPTGVDTQTLIFTELPNEPRIVHVARLVEFKGAEDLIDAFAIVRSRVPQATLDIVGDGPLRERLAEKVRELKLEDSVVLHGALVHSETIKLMRQARVLVLPSRSMPNGATEGLGQVSLEAMALGRVVVATHTGGIPEAVQHEETGLLVGERSPEELASAVHLALVDPDANKLARAGRRSVESNFDVRSQAKLVELIYDRARSF